MSWTISRSKVFLKTSVDHNHVPCIIGLTLSVALIQPMLPKTIQTAYQMKDEVFANIQVELDSKHFFFVEI